MSLKALSIQHLKGNQQGNNTETLSFLAGEPMETASFWRAFYLEASRIYQNHKQSIETWQEHQKHLKYADTLLFLELPQKAATEFKLALEALHTAAWPAKELEQCQHNRCKAK